MSYRLGLHSHNSSASPIFWGRPVNSLFRISSFRPIRFTSIPSNSLESRCTHAKAPTIKYSALAELSDSINSLNSLCIGIRILPGLKIEQDLNALSRGQSKVFFHISGVGFFMTGELTNDHFHPPYFSASIRPTTRKAIDEIS